MTPAIHPLARHGTTQRERLLKALIPDNLLLDDRNLADLMAFAGQYAQQIRFWEIDDTPQEDWTTFFEKDATALLAIVAATDLEEIRLQYRNDELTFVQACKKEKQRTAQSECEQAIEHLYPLVEHIFRLAHKLLALCQKLPEKHPLKTEMQALIREKLGITTNAKGQKNFQTPIAQLISYHKVSHAALERDGEVIDLYEAFFDNTPCAQAWGLTTHDFLTCIDFRLSVNASDRETLWRLFLTFYKVLSWLVNQAQKAFQSALHGRRDHPPHIALLVAFLLLFRRYHQADMNALVAKHLLFYYQDVLRLQYRREIPDKVHLVFEIAQNLETYRLQKGTLLLGGQDANGLDRLYTLTDELVANKAKLIDKQSVYFCKNSKTKVIALPAADLKNGIKVPYPIGDKLWHPLSGLALYQKWQTQKYSLKTKLSTKKVLTKEEMVFAENLNQQLHRIIANPGLLIASPELWLAKGGRRTITVVFGAEVPLDQFYTEISTADGVYTFPVDFNTPNRDRIEARAISKAGLSSRYVVAPDKNTTVWQLRLPADFAAIAPPKDPQAGIDSEQPFVKLRLKENADYAALMAIQCSGISIKTSNEGLRNISLQVGSTPYAPTSEIMLMGSTLAQTKVTLYATAAELATKTVKDAQLMLPFSDVLDHDTPHSITTESSTFSQDFLSPIPISATVFENPLVYSPAQSYPFFRREITIPRGDDNTPVNLYKLPPESISISYESEAVPPMLYWVDFLGGYSKVQPQPDDSFLIVPPYWLPAFEKPIVVENRAIAKSKILKRKRGVADAALPVADGNLRLGFEALQPGQTLSLLFHFADGTGNPDHIAPDEIVWAYLRQNEWVRLPPQCILIDETLGLRQTGLVRLQIPFDINNDNTRVIGQGGRKDLFWLQASASEDPENGIMIDALPMLIDIFPQAATAVFQNQQNELSHLHKGLPAQTITQLRFREASVTKVEQPFGSFGGNLPEAHDIMAYHQRIHERLRHKQRAITLWDYERLTLQQFSDVSIAKCLPHTRDTNVLRPGYITMGVVPSPDQMIGSRKFYPVFNAGVLETIEQYLNRHNSYFVSRQGSGVVCCCDSDDGCGCSHEGHLLVRNALFEPVRLQVCVKFRAGKDAFYYKKQLNEDLKNFLAPWATDSQKPLLFGAKIHSVELLYFLENLDYVDVVMGLKVKHFSNREMADKQEDSVAFEAVEEIPPFTSRSVLTTYLDILNEDNPNVIDHDIQIIEDQSCCADCE